MADKQLKITYVGDASGLQKTLDQIDKAHQSLGSKLKSVGDSMASAGKTMSTHFTLPIVAGMTVALNEFTQFQQVQMQTKAALDSTGGAAGVTVKHIDELSSRIGHLSAVDGEVVQQGENVLLTFTNIRNEVGKGNNVFDQASLAASNLSARLGKDLPSAATLVGKALNDPIKGLSALSRVGVQFSDSQKKLITRLVESGDTMKAQKVILHELNVEFGGSAKAAGAAASPFTKLKLAALDMAQSFGQVLMPIAQKLASFFGELSQKFQALSPHARQVIAVILGIVAAIGPLLIIVGKVVSAFGVVANAAKALYAVLAANPWVLIAAAVAAVAILIITHWQQVKDFVIKIWNDIKGAAEVVWDHIKGVIVPVITVIATIVKTEVKIMVDIVKGAWEVIRAVTHAVWPTIKGIIVTVFDVLKSIFQINFKLYESIVKGAWNAIREVTHVVWGLIKDVILGPLDAIWDHIKGFIEKVKPIWKTFWDTIKSVAMGIWDTIVGAARTGLNGIILILNGVIHAVNALIHGFNAIPFHTDVPTIPTIPALAKGGVVTQATLALIGERGPEAVVPLDRAGIAPLVINVAGSVITERDLMRVVRKAANQGAPRNGLTTGF